MSAQTAFTWAKKLAKELPGKDVESKRDADEAEEVDAQKEVLTQKMDEDVKSIDICQLLDEFVTQSTDADEIDKRINGEVAEANQPASNGNGKKRKKKQKNKKLTTNDIREYNESLVNGAVSDEVQVKDLLGTGAQPNSRASFQWNDRQRYGIDTPSKVL